VITLLKNQVISTKVWRELITDYWCQKKKEARIAGREYTDID
jgi:hypothetical protein